MSINTVKLFIENYFKTQIALSSVSGTYLQYSNTRGDSIQLPSVYISIVFGSVRKLTISGNERKYIGRIIVNVSIENGKGTKEAYDIAEEIMDILQDKNFYIDANYTLHTKNMNFDSEGILDDRGFFVLPLSIPFELIYI